MNECNGRGVAFKLHYCYTSLKKMQKLEYNTLEEILTVLRSNDIEQFNKLEYRLLIIQACSLFNHYMVRGQSLHITRVLANEYARLTHAYNVISRSFDNPSKAQAKELVISAIMTILFVVKNKQSNIFAQEHALSA